MLAGLFVLSLFGAQLFRLQALDSSTMASAALKSRLNIVTVPTEGSAGAAGMRDLLEHQSMGSSPQR